MDADFSFYLNIKIYRFSCQDILISRNDLNLTLFQTFALMDEMLVFLVNQLLTSQCFYFYWLVSTIRYEVDMVFFHWFIITIANARKNILIFSQIIQSNLLFRASMLHLYFSHIQSSIFRTIVHIGLFTLMSSSFFLFSCLI